MNLISSSMNNSIFDGFAFNDTFAFNSERNIIEASYSIIVNCEFRFDLLIWILFRIKFSRRLSFKACKSYNITRLTSFWWYQQLSCLSIGSLGAKDHTMGHIVGKLTCSQVAKDDTKCALHMLNRYKFLKTTGYTSDLTISNINLFIVKLFRIRVFPDLCNTAYSEVHI